MGRMPHDIWIIIWCQRPLAALLHLHLVFWLCHCRIKSWVFFRILMLRDWHVCAANPAGYYALLSWTLWHLSQHHACCIHLHARTLAQITSVFLFSWHSWHSTCIQWIHELCRLGSTTKFGDWVLPHPLVEEVPSNSMPQYVAIPCNMFHARAGHC